MERKRVSNESIPLEFVEVESLSDIARSTYTSEGANSPIFSLKHGDTYTLFSIGESFGNVKLAYSFKTKRTGRFCSYIPRDNDGEEKAELIESFHGQPDFKRYAIPIIGLAGNPFTERKIPKSKFVQIRAEDYRSIAAGMVSKNIASGIIGKMYIFGNGGKRYIGCFGLIQRSEKRVFIYSTINSDTNFRFLKLDPLTGVVSPTETYTPDVCLSVIRLSKPFHLFRPE